MWPNNARIIDVISVKCVQILIGISTKIHKMANFMGFNLRHKRRKNFFDLVKASKIQNVTKYCYEYRRKKFKMCPNTGWNIDQYFTKRPILSGFRVGNKRRNNILDLAKV